MIKYLPLNILNFLDLLLTNNASGSPGFTELNPFYYVPGFHLVKIIGVMAACLLVEYGIRRFKNHNRPELKNGLLHALAFFTGALCMLVGLNILKAI